MLLISSSRNMINHEAISAPSVMGEMLRWLYV